MSLFSWLRRLAINAELRALRERKRRSDRMAREMVAEYHAAEIAKWNGRKKA